MGTLPINVEFTDNTCTMESNLIYTSPTGSTYDAGVTMGFAGDDFIRDNITVKWFIKIPRYTSEDKEELVYRKITYSKTYNQEKFNNLSAYGIQCIMELGFELTFQRDKHLLYTVL